MDLDLIRRGVRSERRAIGAVGLLMAALGLSLCAGLLFAAKGGLGGRVGAAAAIFLVFALPGLLMIRKWLQDPSTAPIVQLLCHRRADIARVYPRYLTYGGGTTHAELHVVDREGRDHHVQVPLDRIKSLVAELDSSG